MIFGTDGIRAPFNEEPLTELTITKLSKVLCDWLPEGGTVLLGRDTRESGPILIEWLTASWTHFSVLDLGVIPTPVVAFETCARDADLGIMITASHNPAADNGLKFFGKSGRKISKQLAEQWSRSILDQTPAQGKSQQKLVSINPGSYEKFLKSQFAPISQPFVFDLAHGAGCPWVENWIQFFFPHSHVLGNKPDGKNINQDVGALYPEALAQEVRESGAKGGFAFDGDGDRLVVVDGHGQIVHGDRVLYGLASVIPDTKHVVGTIVSGLGLEETLHRKGLSMTRTAVGDQNVLSAMLELGAPVGGEPSGHYISGDLFHAGDGFVSALRIAGAICQDDSFLENLNTEVPVYPQLEQAFTIRHKPPLSELVSVGDAVKKLERTLGQTGRVILRYSGTERKIRLFIEAQNLERVDAEIKRLVQAIKMELQ